MTGSDDGLDLNRRRLLAAAGVGGAGLAAAFSHPSEAEAVWPNASASTPPVSGLHLQFGADASTEVVVSWHSLQPVLRPRALLGRPNGALVRIVEAKEARYTDAKSAQVVYAWHARIVGLEPDTVYMYAALHEGAQAEFASFRTAPRGRARFSFTSFGDQGTPTLGRKGTPAVPLAPAHEFYVNDNLGSPAAGDVTSGVERLRPLFHLFNGDLCYANLAQDRVRAWWDFWANNSRSARNRPWMPSPGNHENELGNGPIGYQAYQTYFCVPETTGQNDLTRGLWYAFTVGSVRVISIANDDVCYQHGGDSYVRGYSAGAQRAWLERTLAAARSDVGIDWVVICMHQVAVSTADQSNGADLGVREEWVPLFDRYEVDLVVCGHEHHYERSHPIRGQEPNQTRTPLPVADETRLVDTSKGTVHMVIGGGGTSVPSNGVLFDPPQCRVIVAVGPPDLKSGRRTPVYIAEHAPWSAVRNAAHPYGFAEFQVDPGQRGGKTSMRVSYYDVVGVDGRLSLFEQFTLERPRRDQDHPSALE